MMIHSGVCAIHRAAQEPHPGPRWDRARLCEQEGHGNFQAWDLGILQEVGLEAGAWVNTDNKRLDIVKVVLPEGPSMTKGGVETGKAYMNSLENLDADWVCESDDAACSSLEWRLSLCYWKWGLAACCFEANTLEARLVKMKVILESGNQDGRWAHVQKLIPCPLHHATPPPPPHTLSRQELL